MLFISFANMCFYSYVFSVSIALLGTCFGGSYLLIESVNRTLFEKLTSPSLLSCSSRCEINAGCHVFAYHTQRGACDLGSQFNGHDTLFSSNGTVVFSLASLPITAATVSESTVSYEEGVTAATTTLLVPEPAHLNTTTWTATTTTSTSTTTATTTNSVTTVEMSTSQASFVIVNQFLSWNDAETYCNTNFSGLATIVNATVQEVLRQTIEASGLEGPFWSAGKVGAFGRWYWNFKDRTDETFSWTNWNTGEPSTEFMFWCMQLMDSANNFAWGTSRCSTTRSFLCSL